MQIVITAELILYGCFKLQYMNIIEGPQMAIKYYIKFGIVYELMIALWCGE